MKRWALGSLVTAATTALLLFACDLDLKPFVESPDVQFANPNRDGAPTIEASTDDAGGIADGAADVDAAGFKRVFVTSNTVPGQFLGIDGGDAICNSLAQEARLNGRFVAWVSVANAPAIGRLTGNGPWYLVDRQTRVFASKTAITTTFAEAPIDRDQTGARVNNDQRRAWTGTLSTGAAAGPTQTCQNFTTILGNGMAGDVSERDAKWTQSGVQDCNETLRLYCFEQ